VNFKGQVMQNNAYYSHSLYCVNNNQYEMIAMNISTILKTSYSILIKDGKQFSFLLNDVK